MKELWGKAEEEEEKKVRVVRSFVWFSSTLCTSEKKKDLFKLVTSVARGNNRGKWGCRGVEEAHGMGFVMFLRFVNFNKVCFEFLFSFLGLCR